MATLLLIDVQNDFHPNGSLAIPTAEKDAERIAALIRQNIDKIDRIIATMDTHAKHHIAHPGFWINDKNEHPAPFTIIAASDLEAGKWKPRLNLFVPVNSLDPTVFADYETVVDEGGKLNLEKYGKVYAKQLEAVGRFQLCIWPEHCLIGSPGHNVVPVVNQALKEWSDKSGRDVEYIHKGQNMLTEMYSALAADVRVTNETSLNTKLQESLRTAKRLVVCGQAMSHCVNYTLRDIVAVNTTEASNIVLLTDCASAVPGFEEAARTFQDDMVKAGVKLKTSTDADLC